MCRDIVIIDGDWGGDEMQLAAVLLAHPQSIGVIGATAVSAIPIIIKFYRIQATFYLF